MSPPIVLLLILSGLVALDVLALRFGYDSRDFTRPDWPDHGLP